MWRADVTILCCWDPPGMSESEVGKCILLEDGPEVPGDRRIWRTITTVRERAKVLRLPQGANDLQ
jgi:hypothetical protein